MPANVVAPDITTLDTATGVTLGAVFFYPLQSATGDSLNKIGIKTTTVHDAVARKVNILAAGKERDALLACGIGKASGKLPHR